MGRSALSDNAQLHSSVNGNHDTQILSGYETLVEKTPEGLNTISVLVSGVYCAACIQKIEGSLSQEQDIILARLNFTTRRLTITWSGVPEQSNRYIHIIENLGYTVNPFDPQIWQEESKVEERFLLLCLGVAGFAMGNIMLLSVGLWTTTGETMGLATRELLHLISAAIALPTILFSGRPFFRSAIKALKGGHTNMDVPISLALILASSMSLFETINGGEHVYFDSAVMLTFFLLIGRTLDFRARKQARAGASDLLDTMTGFANVIEDGKVRRVLIRDLHENQYVRIAAGENFPVDGQIIEGQSEVDTSLVTGETLPRAIKPEDDVFAGTLNLSVPVTMVVSKPAKDSLLSEIVKLMEQAEQSKAIYVRLADRAARLYTPVVHTLAALAFLGWLFIGDLDWQAALMISITVLIITCPCALGLAVPVVQVLATGKLMKNGVLIKSGDALERLASIDTVLLDKTGTLTLGHPTLEGNPPQEALRLAASLAAHSRHPLSKAISQSYAGVLLETRQVQEHPGQGLEGVIDGKPVRLGSRAWCGDKNAPPSDMLELWLRIDNQTPIAFFFTDHLREDTCDCIEALKKASLTPIIVSGDRNHITQKIAKECGIERFYSEQTPPQKFQIMENLKREGHKILMVGDGLNDAPVLTGATVSMAPGTAIDMAQNAADIIFMGKKLMPVHTTYNTARLAQKLVKQNFTLAVLYNIIAVPLALSGLVTPLVAAIAMSGSSLIVIANSFRLKVIK
ncbi:MAG: cadmium-translocating P-type ATPase [Rhodospirillales bacterium]|nr:cadmium-translocating P-type ATPase [Alphaproteobacteria bacterium]MCB9981269.1 cadmium-translocating P-type ATPase [Rhodospirillales bacterium]